MKSKAKSITKKRSAAVVPAKATKCKSGIASKVKAATPLEVAASELFGNDAEAAAAHGIKLGQGKKGPAKPTPTAEVAPAGPAKKEGTGATILRLIARDQGATLPEIMNATGWLPHSVRGFISTASKKRALRVDEEQGRVSVLVFARKTIGRCLSSGQDRFVGK